MFLRKLTVILVPLAMLVLLCVLMSVLFSFSWYFGGLLIVPADYHGSLYVAVESAFAAYMLAFSIRTGRGI